MIEETRGSGRGALGSEWWVVREQMDEGGSTVPPPHRYTTHTLQSCTTYRVQTPLRRLRAAARRERRRGDRRFRPRDQLSQDSVRAGARLPQPSALSEPYSCCCTPCPISCLHLHKHSTSASAYPSPGFRPLALIVRFHLYRHRYLHPRSHPSCRSCASTRTQAVSSSPPTWTRSRT